MKGISDQTLAMRKHLAEETAGLKKMAGHYHAAARRVRRLQAERLRHLQARLEERHGQAMANAAD